MTNKINLQLQKLGLCEQQINIFNSLLVDSEQTAKQISKSTKISYGKIYDLLNSMVTSGLISTTIDVRPTLFILKNPNKSLENYYTYEKLKSKQKLNLIKESISDLKSNLSIEPLQSTSTVLFDSKNNYKIYSNLVLESEKSIIIVIPSYCKYWADFPKLVKQVKTSIKQVLKKGIKVLIIDPTNQYQTQLLPNNKQIDNLTIIKKNIDYGFIQIDESLTALDLYDPLTEKTFGIVKMYDKLYCENLIKKINKILYN